MGYFYLILCQIIVGSSYPIAKAAVDSIPEWILACVTLGIASIILMPLASKIEKSKWSSFGKDNWIKVGVQSLCACVLYTVFLFFALSHASATVSGIFNGLAPAVVFILSPIIVGEKLNLKKGFSIVVAIIAVLVVSVSSSASSGGTDLIGIIFLLLSVLSVSLFTVFSKKFAVNLEPLTAAAGVCFTGFVITLPFCIFQTVTSGFSYSAFMENGNLPATLYYAVFVWAAAYVLWYYGIPKVAATFGGVAQAIVPIASMVAAVIFFGETLRTVDIIGLVLITVSVIISVFAENGEVEAEESVKPISETSAGKENAI
jgi:drug/metabolite transporter (DMT)-like permease